jgi:broad specificity phosphatase PhoE
MAKIYYISHPRVKINSRFPDDKNWELSNEGIKQLKKFFKKNWVSQIEIIYSSNERKTIDSAEKMSKRFNILHLIIRELSGAYRDRAKIGFLKKEEFEKAADNFYRYPKKSPLEGWERAIDVQKRNLRAFNKIIKKSENKKRIAIWGHGDAGTLILCRLLKVPISRKYDQPQLGCYFIYDSETKRVISSWKPID